MLARAELQRLLQEATSRSYTTIICSFKFENDCLGTFKLILKPLCGFNFQWSATLAGLIILNVSHAALKINGSKGTGV